VATRGFLVGVGRVWRFLDVLPRREADATRAICLAKRVVWMWTRHRSRVSLSTAENCEARRAISSSSLPPGGLPGREKAGGCGLRCCSPGRRRRVPWARGGLFPFRTVARPLAEVRGEFIVRGLLQQGPCRSHGHASRSASALGVEGGRAGRSSLNFFRQQNQRGPLSSGAPACVFLV